MAMDEEKYKEWADKQQKALDYIAEQRALGNPDFALPSQKRPEGTGTTLGNQEAAVTNPVATAVPASAQKLSQAEKAAAAASDGSNPSWYTGKNAKGKPEGVLPGWLRENIGAKALKGMSWRRKSLVGLAAGGALLSLAGGWMGIFNLLNVFQIDHLLRNIEAKAFVRFQVDMDGRTNKWIAAYLKTRLGEVEDKELAPQDRDNFFFRAEGENQTDGANPFLFWYMAMRTVTGTGKVLTKFEQDLYDKEGLKFTSFAYRDGNQVKFRPATITVDQKAVYRFELTDAEKSALKEGRVNDLNGRLSEHITENIFFNESGILGKSADAQARAAIKKKVKEYTKPWQFGKRFYLRKSIQNATGVRDWRFFEKTRDKISDKKIEIRNRVVIKAFPESTKSGKFIQCMFGITSCKTTTDPNNPENRSTLASLPEDCGEGVVNCGDTGKVDEEGNPIKNDETVKDGLTEGLPGGGDNATAALTRKLIVKVAEKLNGAAAVISLIDTLNNINNSMKSGALSSMVYVAKAAAAIGVYQVYGTIADQARTGELTAEEMNNTVSVLAENGGNSESWRKVVGSGTVSTVSAAAETISDDPGRTEFCSPQYQEAMQLPQNEAAAKKAYGYQCPGEKLGGENLAKTIEDGWNKSIGLVVSPILAVYEKSGLSTIAGWLGDTVEKILGPVMQSISDTVLGALGLKDEFENFMAWVVGQVATFLGAGPTLPAGAPPSMFVNHATMGAAAANEHMMRFAGGAATNTLSHSERQQIQKDVLAYQDLQNKQLSIHDKYFSLHNQQSVASNALFAIVNRPFSATVTSAFGSVLNLPAVLLSGRASAATQTGYEAQDFAGAETYDIPNVCKTTEPETMTTDIATNADELGLIDKEDLTWEVLSNYDTFTNKLYEKDPGEKAKQVYNCALFDAIVSGSLGARANPDTLGPNAYGADAAAAAVPTATGENLPQGTAKELAQKILDHPNITFQVLPRQEDAMKYIAANGKGRDCGAPDLDPRLLGLMLMAADRWKMTYGVVVDDHDCNGGFHPRGMAVDINGIVKLDGSASTANGGHNIQWTSAEMALLKEFYDTMGPIMSTEIGAGGLGQIQCFRGTKPTRAPNVSYFNDTCHHIHMDIGKR